MLLLLLAVGVVIFLAYLTTLLVAKKSNTFLHNRSIKVLERSGIGPQMGVTIVQIANKVYFLATQNKNITVLDIINAEEWNQYCEATGKNLNSSNMLNQDIGSLKHLQKLLRIPSFQKGEDRNSNENR